MKKIIIIAGDPNSINSEIIYKSWKKLNNKIRKDVYLIGSYELINKQFKKLKFKLSIEKVINLDLKNASNKLKIIDIPLKFKDPFKVSFANASKYVLHSLNLGHKLAMSSLVKGIINCSIDKRLIISTGKIGITEFLASKCKIYNNSEVMMIHNKQFSVCPLTTHINIKNINKNITTKLIIQKITTLNKYYKKLFKKKPRIGVLGLNPHNGELKKNSEERLKIIPAILKLKNKDFNINGPLVADTVFVELYKRYDVLVGMYHDQVLAPFKAIFHFKAINVTLGLNYVRVSPDHGPALNLLGKNKANYASLMECIKFINRLK
jgi:4-hydroxy-L-threonine phosphate dehydrogenase PdxA